MPRIDNLFKGLYVFAAILYVILSLHLPVTIFTSGMHDDAWFISHAQSVIDGHWMGEFSQMTLMKGAGYVLFLALNSLVGTPVTLAHAIFFLICCAWLVWSLRQAGLHWIYCLPLFVFLLFEPALFPVRIIRDNIYLPLLWAALAGFFPLIVNGAKDGHLRALGVSGIALGFFWITREEGIWIVPAIAILASAAAWRVGQQRASFGILAKGLAVYAIAAVIPVIAVSTINLAAYGSFEAVDFKEKNFARMLDALNAVQVGAPVHYVPVHAAKRAAIYNVSPSFRDLQPNLEDPANAWKGAACWLYGFACGDYGGGWFMWALRDGVATLGYYKNPDAASAYYRRVSDEIDAACSAGQLTCSYGPIHFMPRLSTESWQAFPNRFAYAIGFSTYRESLPLTVGESQEPIHRLEDMTAFLGFPKIVPAKAQASLELAGWYLAPAGDWFSITCGNGTSIPVTQQNSPDIAAHFQDPTATERRFSLNLENYHSCSIVFNNPKYESLKIDDIVAHPPHFLKIGEAVLNFDVASANNGDANSAWALKIKSVLLSVYRGVSFPLLIVGALAFAAHIAQLLAGRVSPTALTIAALVFWVVFLARLALVVLVDVTSFPAVELNYLQPAFGSWPVAAFCSIALFFNQIGSSRQIADRSSVRLDASAN